MSSIDKCFSCCGVYTWRQGSDFRFYSLLSYLTSCTGDSCDTDTGEEPSNRKHRWVNSHALLQKRVSISKKATLAYLI